MTGSPTSAQGDPLRGGRGVHDPRGAGQTGPPGAAGPSRLLNHPSAPVRTRTALALWQIDRDPRSCLVSLADGLRYGHALPELLDALAEMGPLATAADRVLPLVAEGELYEKVDRVMLALRESAVPALVRAYDDPPRWCAARPPGG